MVKQTTEIRETKMTPVENIILGGVLQLDFSDKVKLAEKCGHEGCLKFQHCVECGCERCEMDFVDKDERTKLFIRRSRKIHGDKYDYKNSVFTKAINYITITCIKHGDFTQTADSHLHNHGCKKCSIVYTSSITRSTKEEFIKKSKIQHGNKYGYSKIEYKDCKTNVIIICPIHGEFPQTPNNHLAGHGCNDCGIETVRKFQTDNKEEFVEKGNIKHKNKYDYSLVDYVDSLTKIIIICPEHGKFKQIPSSHLIGSGCRKCGIITMKNKQRSNNADFIEKSNKKYKNKYDYSIIEYINSKTDVNIICLSHGIFQLTPNEHLRGVECPECTPISTGEDVIYKILKEFNIIFKYRTRSLGCVNPKTNGLLELDFWINKYNLCIEYDGRQHFSPSSFGSKAINIDKEFEEVKYRDKFKNYFCRSNKINLLRIHYKDFKNIKRLILEAIAKIEVSETGYVPNLYQY